MRGERCERGSRRPPWQVITSSGPGHQRPPTSPRRPSAACPAEAVGRRERHLGGRVLRGERERLHRGFHERHLPSASVQQARRHRCRAQPADPHELTPWIPRHHVITRLNESSRHPSADAMRGRRLSATIEIPPPQPSNLAPSQAAESCQQDQRTVSRLDRLGQAVNLRHA